MSNLTGVTEKQVLRGRILQVCEQAEPLGAGTEVIATALKKEGYSVTKESVSEACRYLAGKELVVIDIVKNDILNISREIAHITAKGTDVLDGTKTVEGIELVQYSG